MINQKGQALLIVIVALTIALVIGINASVRTITSLSRTSRTDTASRALAAAEGGIERFLVLSGTELEDAAGSIPDCPNGPGITSGTLNGELGCIVSFASATDNIDSEAFVTVEAYDSNVYAFPLEAGKVKEINLQGYTGTQVKLCWSSDSATGSDLSFIVYTNTGLTHNALVRGDGANTVSNPFYDSNGTIADNDSEAGYINCRRITLSGAPFGLRVRSVAGNSSVGVFALPAGNSLPLQGYKIVSIGKLTQVGNKIATRKISVIRTLPYLPGPFDFSYYSVEDIVK